MAGTGDTHEQQGKRQYDNSTSDSTYRIGVYGISGSGKTCLLTVLSLMRKGNPGKLSCIRVPLDPEREKDRIRQKSIQLGNTLLDTQTAQLRQRQLPASTALFNIAEGAPLLAFDCAAPQRKPFRVEVNDYSGELADIKLSSEELGSELRKHFQNNVDALLILADAPLLRADESCGSPESRQAHAEGVHRLSTALTVLRKSQSGHKGLRMDVPVALLVSKWDRVKAPSWEDPRKDEAELVRLLDGESVHFSSLRQLRDQLDSTFSPFTIFPVSAFGESTLESDSGNQNQITERPKNGEPFPSFNVEAPFIWCADQLDELRVRELENKASRQKFPWPCYAGGSFNNVRKRIKEGMPLAKRLDTALSRARSRSFISLFIVLIALITLRLTGQWHFDNVKYQTAVNRLPQADITWEEAGEHISFLREYVASPPYRHIGLALLSGKGEAEDLLKTWSESNDRSFVQDIAAETAPEGKIGIAREYLDNNPNGLHRDLSAQTIRDQERILSDRADAEFMEAVKIGNEPKRLIEICSEYLGVNPSGKHRELALQTKRNAEVELERQAMKQKSDNVKQGYDELMNAGQLVDAANIILSNPDSNEGLPEDYQHRAPEQMSRQIMQQCEYGAFSEARNQLATFEGTPARVLGSKKELAELRRHIDTSEDQYLYNRVLKFHDTNTCDQYLTIGPRQVKTMTSFVTGYKEYLEKLSDVIDITITLTEVRWMDGGTGDSEDVQFKIFVNGKIIIDQKGVKESSATRPNLKGTTIPAKLNDYLRISVEFTDLDLFFDDDYGKMNFVVTARELAMGKSIRMEGENGKHDITLKATWDIPEPTLPAYKES